MTYTKNDKYICQICGKKVNKYNKVQHEKRKYHKLLAFCKIKVNEMIQQAQLKSAENIDEREENKESDEEIRI